MLIENDCEPVQRLTVSVAVMVKLNRPVAVGVPLIAPPLASDKPPGRAPDVTANVYGPVPPDAVTLWPAYAVLKMPAGNAPPPVRDTVITGQTTLNVKFCVASVPIPFAAVMIQAYGEPEAVPAPGVPAMVAVLLPLSVNVTPLGSVPVRVIPLVGKPVVLTVNVWPLTPWVKVALLALVMAGAWLMVSVKFCVAFGVTPLLPVMTIG